MLIYVNGLEHSASDQQNGLHVRFEKKNANLVNTNKPLKITTITSNTLCH